MYYFITICVLASATLETLSYYKQIIKTLKTHKSKDVSSSSYELKLLKYFVALLALGLSENWVGFGLEVWALLMCLTTTIIIIKNKPINWRM